MTLMRLRVQPIVIKGDPDYNIADAPGFRLELFPRSHIDTAPAWSATFDGMGTEFKSSGLSIEDRGTAEEIYVSHPIV